MLNSVIHWTEDSVARSARWLSDAPVPARVVIADDAMTADAAYGLACQGTALLWRGDYQNARQMLKALANRAERRAARNPGAMDFNRSRQARAQRARTLAALLVPLDASHSIPLRRAPDVRAAIAEAFGPSEEPSVVPLQALVGAIGAHEWRTKGIDIPAAGGRIHPHYGVFAPIRHEYIALVSNAPLPASVGVAFDVGTGTGVLAAVLARRGVDRVIATDLDPRAIACARENIERLELSDRVEVIEADLFPAQRAALAVCNPPWIPARPTSSLERAIYDPESQMLRAFVRGLPAHLEAGGEGWLILSDIAEHLGLRSREELLALFAAAGVEVVDRIDIRPTHPRTEDKSDPLHTARAAEVTSLWRLTVR